MLDLMRKEVPDDWGIKDLQNCLLNIMKYIHDFCEENSIEYFIMGGTALGAIRHGGFIPWDDDIDIFMTPDNYKKFRKLFTQKGNKEKYYLQDMGLSNGNVVQGKLRLNNSEFVEDVVKDLKIHQGVFIDIMIMLDHPNNCWSRKWQIFWESYIELKSLANRNYNRKSGLTNTLIKSLRIFPKRFLIDYALKQVYKYSSEECDNYFHYYIGQKISKSVYPKTQFASSELIDFETIKLRVPVGVKEYLSLLFGDYMKIPDLNYIRYHQHASKWGLNTENNIPGVSDFSDEVNYW